MILAIEILLGLALLTGIVLLILGLRGTRVDDHPICRRCGFDLFGKPEASTLCSECGADLTHAHAIRHGRRVRRGGLLMAGVALLAIVLSVGGGVAYVALSDSNWRQYAPLWYLLSETDGLNVKARDAAVAELTVRMTSGKLPQKEIDAILDQALKIQGDANKAWITAWGDLVEGAEAANKISKDRWEKYLTQAPNLKLSTRKELRRGDRLPYWTYNNSARVGSRSAISVSYSIAEWSIGPIRHKSTDFSSSGSMLSTTGGGATGSTIELKPDEIASLPDGPQTIKVTMNLKFSRGWNANAMASSTLEMSDTFNLHPANEPTVKFVHDPSLRAGVAKALRVSSAEFGQSWNNKYLNATIMVDNVPVGIGYQVFARIGDKEQKIGGFSCPKGTANHGWSCGGEVNPFSESKIDLILRPSLDAALGTIDTYEVWDEEIVIKDVPVKKKVTTAPATTRAVTASGTAPP